MDDFDVAPSGMPRKLLVDLMDAGFLVEHYDGRPVPQIDWMGSDHLFDGVLFIGDPHLSGVRHGRRIDIDYPSTTLDKLSQALAIAEEYNLLPIIVGDLFSKSRESTHSLLTRLNRLLRKQPYPPLCLAGNHDMKHLVLTDDTALAMVGASGLLRVLSTTNPIVIDGVCVLHPVPHGFELPEQVINDLGLPNVVITHDDFAFGSSYPNATPLREIKGAKLWVNGHMHTTEKFEQLGETLACNVGNIVRQSVDTIDHVPSVWSWVNDADCPEPTRWVLKYQRDMFNLIGTGQMVEADQQAVKRSSLFVETMRRELATDIAKSDDGSILLEDLTVIMDEQKQPNAVRAAVLDLLRVAAEQTSVAATAD